MSDRIITRAYKAGHASSCDGKVPFTSRQVALKAANRRTKRIVYRCFHCHLWHVGTPDPKEKKFTKRKKLIRLFLETELVND